MARGLLAKILHKSYPEQGYYWDYAAQTRMGRYLTRIETDFIYQRLAALPQRPEIVLDAGAGSGRLEPVLLKFASQVMATEVDPSLTGRLARFGDKVVPRLVEKDSLSLPYADANFDAIVCIEVLSLAEQDWFYAECRRLLKPGGTMIIMVTNRHSWKGVIARLMPERYDYGPEGAYQHSLPDIRRRLRDHGFDVRRAAGLNWAPFTRASNNPLVGLLAFLEAALLLRRLVGWSPWVMLEIRKEKDNPH